MAETFVNNAETTLASNINNITTSVVVVNGAVFPSSGEFRILIGAELMKVTARSTNTLTVERGSEGTTAISHVAGDKVSAVLTKEALEEYVDQNSGGGGGAVISTWATRPAPGAAGMVWYQSDGPYMAIDDGVNWNFRAWGLPVTPPDFTGFAWTNQLSSTLDTSKGAGFFSYPSVADPNAIFYGKSTPATPFTFTVMYKGMLNIDNFFYSGIGVRNSSSGALAVFGQGPNMQSWGIRQYNSPTSVFGNFNFGTNFNSVDRNAFIWLRYEDDGTNRKIHVSLDGFNFVQLHSELRTNFVTADQIGILLDGPAFHVEYITLYSMIFG